MKITKDDLRTIINEVLEEGQWYDIKVKGAGSKKKKAAKKSKRVKKMPNIPGQPGGKWAKSVATMEEGDEVFQSPEQEDCDDWADLIAIAKALNMSKRAVMSTSSEAAVGQAQASKAAATAGGEGQSSTKPVYKVSGT